MRDLLLDTSVLLKWFHRSGEDEIEQAEWHLQAHRQGVVRAHILDLGVYELGNVLVRSLGRTDRQARAVLDAALALCGPPLALRPAAFGEVADIAYADDLTFYDAAFAVAAREHDCALVSADERLLAAKHAITLTQSMHRLRGLPGTEVPDSTPKGDAAFMGPVRLVKANGIDIGYRQVGTGKPLLLIMGFGGTISLWQYQLVQSLVDAGFQVTMFDNRGVGYSTDDVSQEMTVQLMAQDTAALIGALGLTKPAVVGWSMGGEIALTLAGSQPDLVASLVTSGGDAGSTNYLLPTSAVQKALEDATPDALLPLLFPEAQAAAQQAFIASVGLFPQESVSPTTLKRQLHAEEAFSEYQHAWDNLSEITAPTIIQNGALDQITRPINAKRVAARIPGAELVLYPDAAHGSLFQDYEQFTGLVVKASSGATG